MSPVAATDRVGLRRGFPAGDALKFRGDSLRRDVEVEGLLKVQP